MGVKHGTKADLETFWVEDPGFSFTINWDTGIICVPEGRTITDENLRDMEVKVGKYISRDELIREMHEERRE